MAREYWTDAPLHIAISGKTASNSGIPKLDITSKNDMIWASEEIRSSDYDTTLSATVSNNAANNTKESVSGNFYLSRCLDADQKDALAEYQDESEVANSTDDLLVTLYWDSVDKSTRTDDTSMQYTINNVMVKNAVETVEYNKFTIQPSIGDGSETIVSNDPTGVPSTYKSWMDNGLKLYFKLYGEYHEDGTTGSNYLSIYDSTVEIQLDNNAPISYVTTNDCSDKATGEIYGMYYFTPTNTTDSSSVSDSSIFSGGKHSITITAQGSATKPSATVYFNTIDDSYDVALLINSFVYSNTTPTSSGVPTISFKNGLTLSDVNVVYSCDGYTIDSTTGKFSDYIDNYIYSLTKQKICTVTATCTYHSQKITATAIAYFAPVTNYIKFENVTSTQSKISITNTNNSPNIYYGVDTIVQHDDGSASTEVIFNKLSSAQSIPGAGCYIFGDNKSGLNFSDSKYTTFNFSGGAVNGSGDMTALIDGFSVVNTVPSEFCFNRLFYNATLLKKSPSLSSFINLSFACYRYMFYGSGLTETPALPASSVPSSGYQCMFQNCDSLIEAPELPAVQVDSYGYNYMFAGCTTLKQAPTYLPATTIASSCYAYMFYNCPKLVYGPSEISALNLKPLCYNWMFGFCTSLRFAPYLPAETLVDECYNCMFNNCTSLVYVKAMFTTEPTDVSGDDSYNYFWLYNIDTNGVLVKNPDAEWVKTGANGTPDNWTVVFANDYKTDYANICTVMTVNDSDNPYNDTSDITSYLDEIEFLTYDSSNIIANIILTDAFASVFNNQIPDNGFSETTNLRSFGLPSEVNTIGISSFYQSTLLTTIDLTNNESALTLINSNAFEYCSSLTSVILPNTLENIQSNAFDNCDSLNYIYYNGTTEEWSNVVVDDSFQWFVDQDQSLSIICQDGTVEIVA